MCKACLADDKILTTTTFTVEYNECIIVVKTVPCLECQLCGTMYFTDEVSAKLEALVESAKKVMQDISVIDYRKVA